MTSNGIAVSIRMMALGIVAGFLLTACSTVSTGNGVSLQDREGLNYGVLVMAHGGGSEWNGAVLDTVAQMRAQFPVAVAFGMADAGSLEAGVRKLEAAGVEHVGVVRMFISGESWYQRTRQILGLEPGAPTRANWEASNSTSQRSSIMPMGFWRIETELKFHLTTEGLANAVEMDQVILHRLQVLSEDPVNEVALILAHGPAEDAENARWVAEIAERTEKAKQTLGLAHVQVLTLREDWRQKRVDAEESIRDYVTTAQLNGQEVLVVPYRLQGFGPYADVLTELTYKADGTGLLPHQNVGIWVSNQAMRLYEEAASHQQKLLAAAH